MSKASINTDEIETQLLDIVAKEGLIERDKLHMDAELASYSIPSADFVLILMEIEDRWGVYIPVDEDLTDAKTVRDLVEMVIQKIEEAGAGDTSSPDANA